MYDLVRHRVLLGTGKGGTPDQHSSTDEPPRERWCVIKSARGVTQCVENSGKGKTIETEDPSVSRKIKKGSRRPEGALWKYASSQLCRDVLFVWQPGLIKLNFTVLNCIIIKPSRGCSN